MDSDRNLPSGLLLRPDSTAENDPEVSDSGDSTTTATNPLVDASMGAYMTGLANYLQEAVPRASPSVQDEIRGVYSKASVQSQLLIPMTNQRPTIGSNETFTVAAVPAPRKINLAFDSEGVRYAVPQSELLMKSTVGYQQAPSAGCDNHGKETVDRDLKIQQVCSTETFIADSQRSSYGGNPSTSIRQYRAHQNGSVPRFHRQTTTNEWATLLGDQFNGSPIDLPKNLQAASQSVSAALGGQPRQVLHQGSRHLHNIKQPDMFRRNSNVKGILKQKNNQQTNYQDLPYLQKTHLQSNANGQMGALEMSGGQSWISDSAGSCSVSTKDTLSGNIDPNLKSSLTQYMNPSSSQAEFANRKFNPDSNHFSGLGNTNPTLRIDNPAGGLLALMKKRSKSSRRKISQGATPISATAFSPSRSTNIVAQNEGFRSTSSGFGMQFSSTHEKTIPIYGNNGLIPTTSSFPLHLSLTPGQHSNTTHNVTTSATAPSNDIPFTLNLPDPLKGKEKEIRKRQPTTKVTPNKTSFRASNKRAPPNAKVLTKTSPHPRLFAKRADKMKPYIPSPQAGNCPEDEQAISARRASQLQSVQHLEQPMDGISFTTNSQQSVAQGSRTQQFDQSMIGFYSTADNRGNTVDGLQHQISQSTELFSCTAQDQPNTFMSGSATLRQPTEASPQGFNANMAIEGAGIGRGDFGSLAAGSFINNLANHGQHPSDQFVHMGQHTIENGLEFADGDSWFAQGQNPSDSVGGDQIQGYPIPISASEQSAEPAQFDQLAESNLAGPRWPGYYRTTIDVESGQLYTWTDEELDELMRQAAAGFQCNDVSEEWINALIADIPPLDVDAFIAQHDPNYGQ